MFCSRNKALTFKQNYKLKLSSKKSYFTVMHHNLRLVYTFIAEINQGALKDYDKIFILTHQLFVSNAVQHLLPHSQKTLKNIRTELP